MTSSRDASEAPCAPPPGAADETPYDDLHPDTVLDALDAVGLRGDGRLIQLNSYENRVFQVYLETSDGAPDGRGDVAVAKFYRPARWNDAQILEEHDFAIELARAEIPVAAPIVLERDAASTHAPSVSSVGVAIAAARANAIGACTITSISIGRRAS